MAGTKRYGADGPPQLVGKCRPVSPHERLGWFRRVRRLTSRPGGWVRRVVCSCGREDDFRVLITHPFKPLFSRYGIDLGAVHLELACHSCSSEFVVFDNQINGWNAVIAGERSLLPPDYTERVKASLHPASCLCGSRRFGCLVWYSYDAQPDDLPPTEEDWDEAFGWFAAWVICSRCGMAQEVADAETA